MIATPAETPPASLLQPLLDAATSGAEAVLLVRAGDNAAALAALAKEVMAPLQALGVAVLIRGPAALAVRLNADGAEIAAADDIAAARKTLGDRSLGVDCGLSRHDAMVAGEAGADYVAFGPIMSEEDAGILEWWSALMNLPCVARGVAPGIAVEADFIEETVGE